MSTRLFADVSINGVKFVVSRDSLLHSPLKKEIYKYIVNPKIFSMIVKMRDFFVISIKVKLLIVKIKGLVRFWTPIGGRMVQIGPTR